MTQKKTDDETANRELSDRIGMSRRSVLKALGGGAGLAGVGAATQLDEETGIQAAGFSSNLTQQYYRDNYVTSPDAAFDPSQLNEGETFWVTDTGEMGVQGPNGPEHPGVGSASQPVPAVHTEQLNTRVFTVGPDAGNKYQSLATAMDDLRGQGSLTKHYTLYLTGDLTGSDAESAQIEPANHVNIEGNGYTVESTYDQDAAIRNRDGFTNAKWTNFTFDFNPATDPGYSDAIYCGYRSDRNVVFENVTMIGHDKGAGGNAWALADNSNAELRNCVGVGGDGGNGASGLSLKFGCTPNIVGGTFYGGNNGSNCHGVSIGESVTATLTNVVGVQGQGGPDGHGIRIVESAAPTLTGCTGRPKQYAQNLSGATDGDSDTVDAGYPMANSTAPMDSTGWPSVLLSIQLRVLTAATGATIDLGTTAGGTEIASGIDASSTDRKFFDYNRVRFVSGDKIHVSTSDASVELNLRYTLAVDNRSRGLHLDTYGEASISNCQFRSGTRAPAVFIGSNSKTARKFSLSSSLLQPIDTSGQSGLSAASSDSVVYDEIQADIRGGTTNITPGGSTDSGSDTQSGDGLATVFTISHGLGAVPSGVNAWPESADASGDFHISNKTSSAIELTYAAAPASGTNNLTWGFHVTV